MVLPDVFKGDFDVPEEIRSCVIAGKYIVTVLPGDPYTGESLEEGFEVEIAWLKSDLTRYHRFRLSYAVTIEGADFRWAPLNQDDLPFRPAPRSAGEATELRNAWQACNVEALLQSLQLQIAQYVVVDRLLHLRNHRLWCLTSGKEGNLRRTEERAEEAMSILLDRYPDDEHPFPIPAHEPTLKMR